MNKTPKNYFLPFVCLILLLAQGPVYAQKNDTGLLAFRNLKEQAGKHLKTNRRDSIFLLSQEMLPLAEQLDHDSIWAWTHFYTAEGLLRRDPKKGLEHILQALELYQSLGMKLHTINTYNSVGGFYQTLHQYDKSIAYRKKALAAYQDPSLDVSESKRTRRLGIFHYNLGYTSMLNSEYATALEYLFEAMTLAEEAGFRLLSLNIANIVGGVYYQTGKFDDALRHYQRAHDIAVAEERPDMLGVLYNNIALIFREKSEPDSALAYLESAYGISEKLGDKTGMCNNLGNRAVLLAEQKNFEAALDLNYRMLDLADELGRRNSKASALDNISETYFLMKKYDQAIAAAETGLDLINTSGDFQLRADLYHNLHQAYRGRGQFEQSLEAYVSYKTFQDSVLVKANLEKFEELRERFETAEKEQEIIILNEKNKIQEIELRQQQMFMWGSLLIAFLLIGLIYFYFRQRRLQMQQQAQVVEQRLLRSQMNPHFFFNTLASIQRFLFEKEDTKVAVRYLAKLSKLMRQILENSRETYISLGEEIKTLDNYLSLQQLRYEDQFQYRIEVSPGLDVEEILIPPMIAQPFVENAIEHGRLHQLEGGTIQVRFSKQEDRLWLEIEDNGIGRKVAELSHRDEKHQSLATKITEDRLNLLKRLTRKKCTFQISDLPDRGTKVAFSFPLLAA